MPDDIGDGNYEYIIPKRNINVQEAMVQHGIRRPPPPPPPQQKQQPPSPQIPSRDRYMDRPPAPLPPSTPSTKRSNTAASRDLNRCTPTPKPRTLKAKPPSASTPAVTKKPVPLVTIEDAGNVEDVAPKPAARSSKQSNTKVVGHQSHGISQTMVPSSVGVVAIKPVVAVTARSQSGIRASGTVTMKDWRWKSPQKPAPMAFVKPESKLAENKDDDDDDDYEEVNGISKPDTERFLTDSTDTEPEGVPSKMISHLHSQSETTTKMMSQKPQKQLHSTFCEYSSLSDIPDDLDFSNLSITEVGHCLKLLNMPEHIETFKRHDIDGCLLCDLDKDILEKELYLTHLQAKQWWRLIHQNWRPKQ